MTAVRRHPHLSFLLAAGVVYATSRVALASAASSRNPRLVAVAVALDLTLTAAFLFWFLVVRTGKARAGSAVAVLVAGAAVASRTLPPGQRGLVPLVAALGEGSLLAFLAWRAVRTVRALRARGRSLPFEDAIRLAAREGLGGGALAEAVSTEAGMIALALLSWRRRPDVPAGALPFTCHRTTGQGALVWAMAIAGLAETLGVHALAAHWSGGWAWVATGASVYGLLWLVGDHRAVALRPVLLTASTLHVRVGLRWSGSIPLASITGTCAGPDPARHGACLRASPLGPPNLYLHLAAPAELAGPLGIRRRGDCIGLRVDDPQGLRDRLARAASPVRAQ